MVDTEPYHISKFGELNSDLEQRLEKALAISFLGFTIWNAFISSDLVTNQTLLDTATLVCTIAGV